MKNESPLVSVVFPCYNHEKYIIECLESIKSVDYNNIEIIMIDDGSTDNSFEIAEEWLRRNKAYFANYVINKQENQGVCTTLNRLIKLVNGKYIAWLASDDKLVKNSLQIRVDFLEKNKDKLVVFGDARSIDEDGNILCEEFQKNIMGANKKALVCDKTRNSELILKWSVPGPVLLVDKKIYNNNLIGLYDETLVGEDRDFFLRCMSKNILGYIEETVAEYREVRTSLSRNKDIKKEVAPYWMLSDKKNLVNFHGIEKIFLYLTYIHQLYGVKRLHNKYAYIIQHKLLSLLLRVVYRFVNTVNNITIQFWCK